MRQSSGTKFFESACDESQVDLCSETPQKCLTDRFWGPQPPKKFWTFLPELKKNEYMEECPSIWRKKRVYGGMSEYMEEKTSIWRNVRVYGGMSEYTDDKVLKNIRGCYTELCKRVNVARYV